MPTSVSVPPSSARASVGQPVFGVNLIRDRVMSSGARRALRTAAGAWIAANVLLLVASLGLAARAAGVTARPAPGASSADISALRHQAEDDLALLRSRIAAQQAQMPVAGKLAALSTTLPARTWITQLSGKRESHQITVHAAYLIDPDKPYDVPTNSWIAALRAEPVFAEGLSKLDVSSTSRAMAGDAEIVNFELTAQWTS